MRDRSSISRSEVSLRLRKQLLTHVVGMKPAGNAWRKKARSLGTEIGMQDAMTRMALKIYSPFFSPDARSLLVSTGESAGGGDAGFSGSSFRSPRRLNALIVATGSFSFCCGGVPVREEAPESSPVLDNDPPGPILRPLLLLDENIDVGANDIGAPEARLAPLFVKRRRSSVATVFFE